MNKVRRKRLSEALELISQAKDILEEVKDEEQEAFDNLPESFQYGERGDQMQEYIDSMTCILVVYLWLFQSTKIRLSRQFVQTVNCQAVCTQNLVKMLVTLSGQFVLNFQEGLQAVQHGMKWH